MIGLGDLPGGTFSSAALGVSDDGLVVVGYGSNSSSDDEAFIWDEVNGMRSLQDVLVNDYGLDLTGWTLERATDISADGRTLVGWGNHSGYGQEAWIAMLGPPACLTCPGDSNNNDAVAGEDIQGFVACFLAGDPSATGCLCSDMDGNDSLDATDISQFVNRLVSEEPPCPP